MLAAAAPPGTSVVIGGPRHPGMPWHLDGRRREGGAQGSCAPAGLDAAAPCQVRGQKQRQWWLGTKWESRVLVSALCRSGLLTCAQSSAAETRK